MNIEDHLKAHAKFKEIEALTPVEAYKRGAKDEAMPGWMLFACIGVGVVWGLMFGAAIWHSH